MGIALNAPSPLLVEQVEWRLSAHSKVLSSDFDILLLKGPYSV